jgi:2,3-bisphosphoglycerate-dependent phosphoglycerate mutase
MSSMENMLVLVRHGESEWNKLNLFTGWRDVDLSETGVEEARRAGRLLKAEGLHFDIAFTSALKRAQRTLDIMLAELGQTGLETVKDQALNERDYGDLAGLNKDDARARWGEEQVHIWRRSFDIPPPGGESLKNTAERVLPYYQARIWPEVQAGKTVIVAAHGNSLRALVMQLDGLSREAVLALNLATGVPLLYRLNADGSVADKRDLAA